MPDVIFGKTGINFSK